MASSHRHILLLVPLCAAGALAGAGIALKHKLSRTYISFKTRFGKARIFQVTDDDDKTVRLLEIDRCIHSATYIDDDYCELVFQYLKTYNKAFNARSTIKKICVLGCGGYDYPKYLIAHHKNAVIDAVEIDSDITSLASYYFYLDRLFEEYDLDNNQRLNLITDDSLHHLEMLSGDIRYDFIVNDCYSEGTTPKHLMSMRFFQAVKEHLNDGGIYAVNTIASLSKKSDVEILKKHVCYLQSFFSHVYILPCDKSDLETPDNNIIFASDQAFPPSLSGECIPIESL